MKNPKQPKGTKPLYLPAEALEDCGASDWNGDMLMTAANLLLLHKAEPTAMELIHIIDVLSDYVVTLTVALADACGLCDDCGDGCSSPREQVAGCELCANCTDAAQRVHIPDAALEEAGIPLDAKLEAYPGEDGEIVVAPCGYEHDISDVPQDLLRMLANAGVCLPELDEMLMLEKTIPL